MSRKGFTKYIKGLALGVSQTSNLTLRYWASWSFISVMHSSIPMCSLLQNQKDILSKGKTHLAARKRTMESNFSFLLNWAACPDSFVHMCTLSGSNYGLVGFNIKSCFLMFFGDSRSEYACLQLVRHNMEAVIPALTNIFLQIKSLFASLWTTFLPCFDLVFTVPRLELRNQFVFSQLRKLPWGNSWQPVTWKRRLRKLSLGFLDFHLSPHIWSYHPFTFNSCSSVRASSQIWKSATFPCIDIIGQFPVLYTHLQIVFLGFVFVFAGFGLTPVACICQICIWIYGLCIWYPPNRNNVNLFLVLLVGLLHHLDASLVIVFLAILKKCCATLRIKISAS